MTTATVSREIYAPLDAVFEHFTSPSEDKRLDLHSDHVKDYKELDRGPDHLEYEFVFQAFGIRFWGKGREEFERPRKSTLYVTGGPLEGAEIELVFEPSDRGTRVSQITRLPPRAVGPMRGLFNKMLLARLQAITAVHLDEHKRDLEGKAPSQDRTMGKAKPFGPLDVFRVTRAVSLPLVVLPLLAGALFGPSVDWTKAIVTLIGGSLALLAGNLMNDIWDFSSGADHAAQAMPEATMTGSGALVDGKLTPKGAWVFVGAMVAIALAAAVWLSAGRPWVLAFAGLGMLITLFYEAPPFRASYRGYGLGELCIWAAFGPVPVVGAYYVQNGTVSLGSFLLGAVFGFGAALVLYCHHFLHWQADQVAGKKSPVAMMGPAFAARIGLLATIAYGAASVASIAWLFGASPGLAVVSGIAPAILIPSFIQFARESGSPAWRLLSSAFVAYVVSSITTVVALWRS